MIINIDRKTILEGLQIAQRFSSDKINTPAALQFTYVVFDKNQMHLYATDLNTYCHVFYPVVCTQKAQIFIEPRKPIEFLQMLQVGAVDIGIGEKSITISQGKTKGMFPLVSAEEFPMLPTIKEKGKNIGKDTILDRLPLLLFSASSDEARPALTGVSFISSDEGMVVAATDGFRLSVIKEKNGSDLPSMIIPSVFLREIGKYAKDQSEVEFVASKKEQIVKFTIGNMEFYSRMIDGDFPPYERVIPDEKKASASINREDLFRSTKIISIFARDHSNVVIFDFSKKGLIISPKKEASSENSAALDIAYEGEPMRIAFNYKYILDFLNNTTSDEILVELLRSDTPTVFKPKGDDNFMHIIMPVRIQE